MKIPQKLLRLPFLISLLASLQLPAQLPENTNKSFGAQITGTTLGTNSEDWYYGLLGASNSDIVGCGYTASTVGLFPVIVNYSSGNVAWETRISVLEVLH